MVVYLRSVPPVNRATPAKKITVPMFESVFLPAWLAIFAAREMPPAAAPTSGVARGEYLTRAVAHGGECHTPRTMTMAVDNSRFLAGAPKSKGPEGSAVPNITSDRETGIGSWSEEQITDYLETGNKPDGDVADGLMAEVIQGSSVGYTDLTKADRLAIAKYLKSIPPVKNRIESGEPSPAGRSRRAPARSTRGGTVNGRLSLTASVMVTASLVVGVAAGCKVSSRSV